MNIIKICFFGVILASTFHVRADSCNDAGNELSRYQKSMPASNMSASDLGELARLWRQIGYLCSGERSRNAMLNSVETDCQRSVLNGLQLYKKAEDHAEKNQLSLAAKTMKSAIGEFDNFQANCSAFIKKPFPSFRSTISSSSSEGRKFIERAELSAKKAEDCLAEAKDVFFTQMPDLLMAAKLPAKYKIEAEGLFEMLRGYVSRQCIVDADTDFVKNLTRERDIFVNEELPCFRHLSSVLQNN